MSTNKSTKERAYKNTHRLAYRLLSAADEALYCDLYTNAEVMRFVGTPLSRDKAASSFKKALALTQQQTFGRRITVIVERKTKQTIGISSIHVIDEKKRCAQIGSMLIPSAHAKGYAVEYSNALIAHAFKVRPVDELLAQVAIGNTAIEGLVKDLGFRRGAEVPASDGRPATYNWTIRRGSWKKHKKTPSKPKVPTATEAVVKPKKIAKPKKTAKAKKTATPKKTTAK